MKKKILQIFKIFFDFFDFFDKLIVDQSVISDETIDILWKSKIVPDSQSVVEDKNT